MAAGLAGALFSGGPAMADDGGGVDRARALGCLACEAMVERLALFDGGPAFLTSFEARPGGGVLPPALAGTAFVYDNAAAAIALVACRETDAARRIGDALLTALASDRFYKDGRLRNAYAAGPVAGDGTPIRVPGYWDDGAGMWREDSYHVGSATGSTTWGALALLTLYEATGDSRYLEGAKRVQRWINTSMFDDGGPGGYRGGISGHEPSPIRLGWKSTEHNTDVYAANRWLAALAPDEGWDRHARHAGAFLDAMWRPNERRFLIGTLDDGVSPNTQQSGLDAQLWPLIAVAEFAPRGDDVFDRTLRDHGVDGGVDFNTDRDGVWLEGTAQAALVTTAFGRDAAAGGFLDTLAAHQVGDGLIYAASVDELTTGLATGPASDDDDFVYDRLPHIGATAWTVLAAAAWNPFTGHSVSRAQERPLSCPQKS
jgi:hypothetical protein